MIDWETLAIEPTDDLRKIKRAYAKQLKVYHPEDNPQEYQHLRQTYERAISFARNKEMNIETTIEPQHETFTHHHQDTPIQLKTPIEEFMEDTQKIYNNFNDRSC